MRVLTSLAGPIAVVTIAVFGLSGTASAQDAKLSVAGSLPLKPELRADPRLPVTTGAIRGPGIDPSSFAADGAAGTTLTNWSGNFTYNGSTYNYTMLGTDPALGSQTTVITAVLIPLRVVFSDGTVLSATAPVFGGLSSALQLTASSPLFKPYPFKPGGTAVGTTQYIDAFQRANFWNIVSTTAPNYHVQFKVIAEPVQTLDVPAYFGYTAPGPGSRIGYVDFNWWDGELGVLLYRLNLGSNVFPMFLNYNIEQFSSNFTYAGYHSSFGSPAHVYLSAGFYDQGILSYGGDIVVLSHEIGEATDDPFVNNFVPPWSNPQEPGTCSNLLEVGDPVSDVGIGPIVLGGYTYHPEDLTFLSWFSQTSPSLSVNGWYTFANTYTSPSTCN